MNQSAESTELEELRKRKAGLEQAALMMAAEGVSIPRELSEELNQVQIDMLLLSDSTVKQRTWTSFLGQEIEGFMLQERLSSGTYSHTFAGLNENTGESAVFKISRSADEITCNPNEYFARQAFRFQLELCYYVDLSANFVLQEEHRRLKACSGRNFITPLSSGFHEGLFYYRTPLLEGQSLKDLMILTDAPFLQMNIELMHRLCTLLDAMQAASPSLYHGNLKPDSIFVTKSDLVLLSPGSFEAQPSSSVNNPCPLVTISTPAYYPFFEKNDLFALALTFWETICKRHPLDTRSDPERAELFEPEFVDLMNYRKSLNHAPLCRFMRMRLPRDLRPDLRAKTEEILLAACKLQFTERGLLTGACGFKSFNEFDDAVSLLEKQGILL